MGAATRGPFQGGRAQGAGRRWCRRENTTCAPRPALCALYLHRGASGVVPLVQRGGERPPPHVLLRRLRPRVAPPLEHVLPARVRVRARPRDLRDLRHRHRGVAPPHPAPPLRPPRDRDARAAHHERAEELVGGGPHRRRGRGWRLESREHPHALRDVPSHRDGGAADTQSQQGYSTLTLTASLRPLSSTTTTSCVPRVGRRNSLRAASPLAISVPSSNQ